MIATLAHYAPTALVIDGTIFLIALAAWLTRSHWQHPSAPQAAPKTQMVTGGGRHRLATVSEPYRPRSAPPVIPGPDPLTADERKARAIPMPVTEPDWHRPTTALDVAMPPAPDATDWTVTLWDAAAREGWARRTVAAAGHSWETHMAKFSGAVIPREDPEPAAAPATPDDWFGDHLADTRQLNVAL